LEGGKGGSKPVECPSPGTTENPSGKNGGAASSKRSPYKVLGKNRGEIFPPERTREGCPEKTTRHKGNVGQRLLSELIKGSVTEIIRVLGKAHFSYGFFWGHRNKRKGGGPS